MSMNRGSMQIGLTPNRSSTLYYKSFPIYQVWTLWNHSFLSYAADKQTNRRSRTSYPCTPTDIVGVGNEHKELSRNSQHTRITSMMLIRVRIQLVSHRSRIVLVSYRRFVTLAFSALEILLLTYLWPQLYCFTLVHAVTYCLSRNFPQFRPNCFVFWCVKVLI